MIYELSFTSEIIEQTIKKHDIKLVIFDPLQAFLGAHVDMYRANQIRPIMAHLAAMAKRTGCAVIIISHMGKGTIGSKAIYRSLGSIDIPAAARSVIYIERNPDDNDQCVMVHVKCSNDKEGKSILYRIGERGGVTWEGYSNLTYGDLQMRAEYTKKGISFEDDPHVQVIKMFHQDNPKGAFISWVQLSNYANKSLGHTPCQNGKEWRAKLDALQRDFIRKCQIQFEFKSAYLEEPSELGQTVRLNKKKKVRGVKIMPYKPDTEFQTHGNEKDAV